MTALRTQISGVSSRQESSTFSLWNSSAVKHSQMLPRNCCQTLQQWGKCLRKGVENMGFFILKKYIMNLLKFYHIGLKNLNLLKLKNIFKNSYCCWRRSWDWFVHDIHCIYLRYINISLFWRVLVKWIWPKVSLQ